MSRQKEKGTRFESMTVSYLRGFFQDTEGTIDRASLHGSADIGDIRGVYSHGEKVAIECKDRRKYEPKKWLEEAETERGNADAAYGVVVFHVNGIGIANMGEQGVLMTLETFCRLIGGEVEAG